MARPSYGPQARKRGKRLLEILLAYANDEFDDSVEQELDALRPQIQTRWLEGNKLVVRTKVRFLQELSSLHRGENSLTSEILKPEQIKEALKRYSDFLEILEDNRPTRGGSETWHFTLKLWYRAFESKLNLQKFDQEWERLHPANSKVGNSLSKGQKQVITQKVITNTNQPEKPGKDSLYSSVSQNLDAQKLDSQKLDSRKLDYWRNLCHHTLATQNQTRLTTNTLTGADGIAFDVDEIYVPLRLVTRNQRDRRSKNIYPSTGSQLYESEDMEMIQTFTPHQFLEQIFQQSSQQSSQQSLQSQRIAIIGEPGAGKTTLLQNIAVWLLKNTQSLPVWVSLADLQEKTLEEYLINEWLRNAIAKRHISPEEENEFCELFHHRRVWLLLDAVDEMAIESTQALTKIAGFLKGWVANATVVITSRLNVWDAGKNALEYFDTYRNLNFTYGDTQKPNQVEQFIYKWFGNSSKNNSEIAEALSAELQKPEKQRIRDTLRNPLRLALMCRIWGWRGGSLPDTKFMLYQQFVEAIYDWKQDYFPTSFLQRKKLNQTLGKLALNGLSQNDTRFRFKQSFIYTVLDIDEEEIFQLALQLGWLNQVGISATGEKVYAFYHPTFQEYFAALIIEEWNFFLDFPRVNNSSSCKYNDKSSYKSIYKIFDTQWREVILLWFGRDDISSESKEEFIQALINFQDGCGDFYTYQAYFLAAQGTAESDSSSNREIIEQLIKWRFGYFHPVNHVWWKYPPVISESARVALLKSDRKTAIIALENFVTSNPTHFETWTAAYSLGYAFDPGNSIAVTTLEKMVLGVRNEYLLWQAADCLSKVQPGNAIAKNALIQILQTTKKDSSRRKAAYSLAKIEPQNKFAISSLEKIITEATNEQQRQQAAENLLSIHPDNKIALAQLNFTELQRKNKGRNQSHNQRKKPKSIKQSSNNGREIQALVLGIQRSKDEDSKRRRAFKLANLQPGNPIALDNLLYLVKFALKESVRKQGADNCKKIILDQQIPKAIAYSGCYRTIASLQECFSDSVTEDELEAFRDAYKLLWYCGQKMNYLEFLQVWKQSLKL
ncbi:MAG: NACHT domain-containing protein [Mastigocoleus sp.]